MADKSRVYDREPTKDVSGELAGRHNAGFDIPGCSFVDERPPAFVCLEKLTRCFVRSRRDYFRDPQVTPPTPIIIVGMRPSIWRDLPRLGELDHVDRRGVPALTYSGCIRLRARGIDPR